MLRWLQSARTVLRALVQCPGQASRTSASTRSLCAACAQRLRRADALTCTTQSRRQQLPSHVERVGTRLPSRQFCSLTDTTAFELGREQDSSWKASFPAVPAAIVDEFSDALLCYSATAVSIESDDDGGFAEVTAHFGPGIDPGAAVAAAARAAGLTSAPEHTTAVVPPQTWTQTIEDSYQPLCVVPAATPHPSGTGAAKALWIVPDWSDAPDPDAVNVLLTPGVAFGTGDHATTRMCLQWLHSHEELQGTTVLDYGAGSGVLALAALKLGAAHAVAVDCDPLCARMCAANAELNGVQDSLEVVLCAEDPAKAPTELTASGQARTFDVCVANILRGPLLKIAPRLALHVRPGGWLALSGILEGEQAAEVCRAYEVAGFDDLEVANEEGWSLITGRRQTS